MKIVKIETSKEGGMARAKQYQRLAASINKIIGEGVSWRRGGGNPMAKWHVAAKAMKMSASSKSGVMASMAKAKASA